MLCPEDISQAADEAFAKKYSGNAQMYDAIAEVVADCEATSLKDRRNVLVTDTELMGKVLPDVRTPVLIQREADKDTEAGEKVDLEQVLLEKAVYNALLAKVWRATTLYGPVQDRFDNGLVLCRYGGPRGADGIKGVYVTADARCIIKDVLEPEMATEVDRVAKRGKFVGNVSRRIPAIAEPLADAFDTKLKEIVAVGRAHIPLLVEEYSDQHDFQDDDEGDDE